MTLYVIYIHLNHHVYLQENIGEAVKRLTEGDGVGRIVEATGASSVVNSCFTWLRKVLEMYNNIMKNRM